MSDRGMGSERSALIYLDPETPTVRPGGIRSAFLVTITPAAPRSSSSAETMMAR
jgi:hypothetical protein